MRSHHRLAFCLGLLFACSSAAFAVPTLQLYITGSEYDASTETWLTYDNPFELQVLGAHSPQVTLLSDVSLYIAIPDVIGDGAGDDVWATLVGDGVFRGENPDRYELIASDLVYGTPPPAEEQEGFKMPPHGVYESWYWTVHLADLDVANAGKTVYNYNPGSEDDYTTGDIHYLTVEYSPYHWEMNLMMDVVGLAARTNPGDKWVFAPFSHNAMAAYLPEPGVISLVAVGLAGVALRSGKRRLKRQT